MIRTVSATIALLAIVQSCWAARLDINSAPTADLPGYTTYKLFLALEGAETLRGIDADFRGPMNQVNPAGNATIFHREYDGFFFFLTTDSHFWFEPTSLLAIGASESNSNLTAAFSGLASLPPSNPTLFAKIVTNDPESVSYHLEFDLGTGPDPVVFTGQLAIPEPSTGTIAVAIIFLAPTRRQRNQLS